MPAHSLAAAPTLVMLSSSPSSANRTGLPARAFLFLGATLLLCSCHRISPFFVSFSQSASTIQAYEFVEVTASVTLAHASNPFTDGEFDGWFEPADHSHRWQVEGFCDSMDGAMFRIRFMPPAPGDYTYSVKFHRGWSTKYLT